VTSSIIGQSLGIDVVLQTICNYWTRYFKFWVFFQKVFRATQRTHGMAHCTWYAQDL